MKGKVISMKSLNLIEIWKRRKIRKLIKKLKNKDERVEKGAEEALILRGEPAVELLIEALKDEDWYIRMKAAAVLGSTGDRRAVEPLIAILNSEDNSLKWEAKNALSRIGL